MTPPFAPIPPHRPGGASRVIQGSFPGGQPRIPRPAAAPPPPARMAARPAAMQPATLPGRPSSVQPAAGPRPILPTAARPGAVQPSGGNAFAVPPGFQLRPSALGQRLPEAVQQKMESFFRSRFDDVRVHVGNEAASIGALAFTIGTDLYFAPGQYNPQTMAGQQLLGHELTHVVQQRAGRVRNPLGTGVAVVQDPALEAEAERMGMRAAMATSTSSIQAKRPGSGRDAEAPSADPASSRAGAILPSRPPAPIAIRPHRTEATPAVSSSGPRVPAPSPRPSAPRVGPSATVQRAIVLLDVNPNDYALHKVLTGLDPAHVVALSKPEHVEPFMQARRKDPSLRALVSYEDMKAVTREIQRRNGLLQSIGKAEGDDNVVPAVEADEDIFIVGHGRSDRVWTQPEHGGEVTDFTSLAKWIRWATPKSWSGRARFLTCNAERAGLPRAGTVTGMLEAALGGGRKATGTAGFVYGMGANGPIKVLRSEFDDLYNPGPDDYNAVVGKHLARMAYTSSNAGDLIGYHAHLKWSNDQACWKEAWRCFVKKMKEIQKALAAEVKKHGDATILEKAQLLKGDQKFQSIIRKQDELFEAFGLWEE